MKKRKTKKGAAKKVAKRLPGTAVMRRVPAAVGTEDGFHEAVPVNTGALMTREQWEAERKVVESQAPMTFMGAMVLQDVTALENFFRTYDRGREEFKKWLFSKFVKGIHYGTPPGCEGDYNSRGELVDKKQNVISNEQWVIKPTIYQAGVKLVIDAMLISPSYEPDLVSWEMAGKPAGTFIRKCTLYQNGRKIGEGTGAYGIGYNGADANTAVKMADKRACMAALLNSIPILSELFTQEAMEHARTARSRSIEGRREILQKKVESALIEHGSKWAGEPPVATWLRSAVESFFGQKGRKLDTIGAVDAFERDFDNGIFNLDTAEHIKI